MEYIISNHNSTNYSISENNFLVNATTPFPNSSFFNGDDNLDTSDFIYDKTYIRIIFISLYTIVFCLCFFGNLLVILVVMMSRRLRSITNFFLANLAFADFCVGVFCVYQNFVIYIVENWVLGDFLCKMYMFIQSLSNMASIFILVVICIERYFAIIYPITCKQKLTPKRLKIMIMFVWIACILCSSPRLFFANTIPHRISNRDETICVINRKKFNSKVLDMVYFVFLYCIPLAIMSLLYTRIAVCLWNSSEQLKKQLNASTSVNQYQGLCRKQSSRYKHEKKVPNGEAKLLPASSNSNSMPINRNSSQNVLRARKGVIKMLIIVVCSFAICNLPIHARKMWQYWSSGYHGETNLSALLTPLTFLAAYLNSAVNPLLYAFLSKNFRRGMKELILCSYRRKRQANNRNHLSLHVGIHRHASTRSTIKANATTVTILNNDHSSECSHEL